MTLKSGKGALKINKDSHLIKKSSSSSMSKPQQRQPVIIYTHSPRVIQTHPSNFMELVQKLTGLSRSDADDTACKPPPSLPKEEAEENETASSVITTEEVDGYNCMSEVKSSFVALEAPMMPDYVNMFGIGTDFLMCSNKAMFNFADPSFMF